ncbi:inner membrane complex protein 1k, putative [Plasmodium berghei]|uniref:Inner membrane complex protein 1k, putative n=2 Tax=Plasmodium berghei TaxID=5821 RepID=A0A509AQT5_PLABA|nr:inner membrane complex protein 1k, putative [Plasmodium berghei ANKA]CXJ02986.1 inner membrane complex protein 1k, putative [Plasmodium berghei]SCL98392.1 inner membrane complex protein 1k, putative [Plasmodium berghei]SCM16822.1 inner membrane complex protein 1k, putative [Plasmodium berghei]SCN28055.1 inner membrane complex protein 1k, putative [Plasmodium berghei]VUC57936.1 inner membrane complex protein 1k, putative [Plasmodium berghei ANKA]|eukprot:XP_034423706.1 inner membrane complex protein 1k, putative [Plasmodium berghei ANKA]
MNKNSEINYNPSLEKANSLSSAQSEIKNYYDDENKEMEYINNTNKNSYMIEQNTDLNDTYNYMNDQNNYRMENEYNEEPINTQYIPSLYGLGRERQALPFKAQEHKIPGQVSPYHAPRDTNISENETLYDEQNFPISSDSNNAHKKLWSWTNDGKLKLQCSQPIIPVSVVQGILRRDKIILIPQVEVTDFVIPKVYNQNIKHDIPKLDIKLQCSNVEIPNVKYVDKEIIIPIITGYTHKFVPKWEIHEVPRPIVKYIGEQKIVEVEVPEIKYVDKIVEREVVVDTVEKRVPKIIEIPKYVDEVQYVWKPIEKIIYIQKFVPKFDVNLECPPPLIVPYPVQTIKHMPPIMVKKNPKIPNYTHNDSQSPQGYVPIGNEYVDQYTPKSNTSIKGIFSACCEVNCQKKEVDGKYCDVNPNPCNSISQEAPLENEINICSHPNPFIITDPSSYLSKTDQLLIGVNS